MLNRYIGDKAFYRRVLSIAIPIVVQNGITTFVSLLDNIMVGQVGTIPMSGVSITNQLLLVFNLCVFGAAGGAGIFCAQFFGKGDHTGVRHTFRFKIIICTLISILGIGLFLLFGTDLLGLYLQGEGDALAAAQTLESGMSYLEIMLLGFLPFALTNAYGSTLRETDHAAVPMVAGIIAVLVNLMLNGVLIFGLLGAPALGVRGAAIATVISRYVELAIVAFWTHAHKHLVPFIVGAYRSLHIPKGLLFRILRKGLPLLVNEFLWSSGVAVLNQCYSTCGLDVVPAMNIASTIQNLANVSSIALSTAICILMGQMLGSGQPKEVVKDANRKLLVTAFACGVLFGLFLLGLSPFFPLLYNTTPDIRSLAGNLICIIALLMPANAYVMACYFTLRAGGQVLVTFLFDSCFMWVFSVSIAFCLSRFTDLAILPLFAICQSMEIVKCILGTYLLKKDFWINNLTQ